MTFALLVLVTVLSAIVVAALITVGIRYLFRGLSRPRSRKSPSFAGSSAKEV